MTPFEPVGKLARWKTIYHLMQQIPVGGQLTYTQIGEALTLDPVEDRHAIQMAVRRAATEYLTVDDRAIEPIPNVGYRVVEPEEHLRLAQHHQTKSRKALTRGQKTITHVDLHGMEPEVRKAFEVTAIAFSALLEYNRRLDTKQKHLETALDSLVTRQERSEDEIGDLRNRLADLEARRKKTPPSNSGKGKNNE